MLLLQGTAPTFMEALTLEVIQQGVNFIESDISRVAMGIFFLCFFFHLLEGALELFQDASTCRLFKMTFWFRIVFTLTLLIGYKAIVVNTAVKVMPTYMLSLGTQWGNMFDTQLDMAKETTEKANQEKTVRERDIQPQQNQGKADDSAWYSKLAKYVVESLLTAVGYLLGIVSGLLITCLVLFEGMMVLGVVTLLIAFGPLCVAFLAHERTEGFFWSFFKTWLVYGLLYIPALNLGVTMAGIVLKHMSTFQAGASATGGDWSDIGMHFVMVFIGPFCAYAMVRAVSTFLAIVFQTGVVGSGSAAFISTTQTTVAAGGASSRSGGGGSGPDSGSSEGGANPAGVQNASAAVSFATSNGGSNGGWSGLGSDVRGE